MITTIDALIQRAEELGLSLISERKDFDSSGIDFLVLHAKDKEGTPWVVRTPRHTKSYEGSINEGKMLHFLRVHLDVELPNWRIHERDIIAYPKLLGLPAWSYDHETGLTWNGLDPADPDRGFLQSTAKFLAQLHAIPEKDVREIGGRVKSIEQIRQKFADDMKETRSILNPSETIWQRWQSWIADDSYWPASPVLIHGDLHPGHMILDKNLLLTGVLDWTECEMADASADFAIFLGCFDQKTLQTILQFYQEYGGSVHPRMAEHVAERWAATAAFVAKWGLDHDNADVIEHGKAQLAAAEVDLENK